MNKFQKFVKTILPITIVIAMILSSVSCKSNSTVQKKPALKEILLNGFDTVRDLYNVKPIDVEPTDIMKCNINSDKNFIKNGEGSLLYEELNGSSHGIFQHLSNTSAAKSNVKKFKEVSAHFYNTSEQAKKVSMIACAKSGATLFIEETLLNPKSWTKAVIDLSKYSYNAKTQIAGFEIRFDFEDTTSIYVDDWKVSLGADDLPKVDLNKLIESIVLPEGITEITEENLESNLYFVDQVYYADGLYNSASKKEKSDVLPKNLDKLKKCLDIIKNINLVIDSRKNFLTKWYYGHALTVFTKEDSKYGGVWAANVPKTPSEQSFKFDIADTSASGKVVFWIYNPMSVDLKAHFHGGWQLWNFQFCDLKANSWNKIEMNAAYFERDIKGQLFLVINGAEYIEGEFKFTSFYGISADIVARPVISAIDELPDISKIDYSYRKQVESIFDMYNDLSEAAKKAVYNYTKLDDIYKKILSLRLPELLRLLDSLNPATVVLPRDYTNIYNAISIYDELPDSDRNKISSAQVAKLKTLKNLIKDYGLLYGEGIENGIDYVWTGTVAQKYDKIYGNYTELFVKNTTGKAQFVDRLIDVDPNEYAQVVFYLYNPTDRDVSAEYSHNWSNNVSLNFKSKQWTEVRINTVDYARCVNFLLFYTDIFCKEPWKMTDLYGVKANIVAAPVIKIINELPSLKNITAKHFNQIANARLAYDSLPSNVKSSVTNYQTLVNAEKRIALLMIDSLPNENNIEMPRDYTNIMFVKKAYDATTKQERAALTKAQQQKLNALFEIVKYYDDIYSKPIESGFDYKWSGDIKRTVDSVYGNVTELYVNSTEKKMAQFADRLLTVDKKYDKVEFYVYNPLGKDVTTEYSHNWKNPTSFNLKSKSWTKISVSASEYINTINLLTFYTDISCKEPWKVTDLYGVSNKVTAIEMDKLIDTIPSKLSISNIELLLSLRKKYDALPGGVKTLVTKYSKLVSAEKNMLSIIINSLASADNAQMPRDYTNTMYAKKIYDSMSAKEKAAIPNAQVQKLNALVSLAENYSDIYSNPIESGFDYKWSGDIKRDVDSVYGNITELYVKNTEMGMAQFADKLLTVDGKYDKVEFYIYNPTDRDITTEYSHNWKTPVAVPLKSKQWTKVSISASSFANTINLLTFYTDISCSSPWKVTDLYGVKAKFYAEKMDALIDTIPSNLTASDIELISSVRQQYDALSERVKKAVTKYSKLIAAEKKIVSVMIDSLPDTENVELPKDYTNIINAKNNYDKLSTSELSAITNEQKNKLAALVEKASVYDVIYSNEIESGFDYKWNGDINQTADSAYGNITELQVNSTEMGMAQFADRLLTVDSKYLYVEFYIYNPMDKDVSVEYSHNWAKATAFTLKSKAWTKIRINAKDYSGVINLMNFYSDISCTSAWKVTDYYGLKAASVAQNIIDKINALPALDNLTLDDKQQVENIKSEYDALPAEIKSLVTNSGVLTGLINKIKELEKAQIKSYPIIIDASKTTLGTDGTIANNTDDSTYNKVFKLSGASYFVLNKSLMTADYKNCNTVYFYIYNPTTKDINGYFQSDYDWSYMQTFLLKSKSWNRIELKDFGSAKAKQFISSDSNIYFYGDFSKTGWKISSFYGISSNTAEDVIGLNNLIDVSGNTLVVDGNITKTTNEIFGNVLSMENSTYFKLGNNLMTSAYKSSSAVVFYVYNPTDTDKDCYYTTDWNFNAYCQFKAKSWNRVEITNFGTQTNKKMLSSGKDIYFYGDFSSSGWLISSFYELDQKG